MLLYEVRNITKQVVFLNKSTFVILRTENLSDLILVF